MPPPDLLKLIARPRRTDYLVGTPSLLVLTAILCMMGCDNSPYGSDGPHSGWFASWAGDVDGDGSQDILISTTCEPVGDGNYGCARVYSTKKREFIWSFANSGRVHPSFWIPHRAGDVNGDGHDDLCSAPYEELRLFDVMEDRALLELRRDHSSCLVPLGDVDGDGGQDLLIGGYPAGKGKGKFASLVSGKTGQTLWSVEGQESTIDHQFAWEGCRVGDVNGDGVADCAVDTLSDRLQILSGRDGSLLRMLDVPIDWMWEEFAGVPDLNNDGSCDLVLRGTEGAPLQIISGATGQVLFSIRPPSNYIGELSAAGDYDRDGTCDFAASEWVFSGRDGHLLATFDGLAADGFRDIDEDGREDLLTVHNLWGPEAEQSGVDVWRHGRVEVLSGSDHSVLFAIGGDDLPGMKR